jgi:uncharacterized protein (TIGR04255 family)
MPVSFGKPPLVELIVELRWTPGGVSTIPQQAGPANFPLGMFSFGNVDAFFSNFATIVGKQGFVQSERLIPPGFPALPFQPVYRYSRQGVVPGHPLIQLGAGVLSVHITPPYRRWIDFRPFVATSLEALLAARPPEVQQVPFSGMLMRYLDCFTEPFTAGRSSMRFLRDILGVDLRLPPAITNRMSEGKEVTAAMDLSVPISEGRTMSVKLANGRIGPHTGLIMDSSISSSTALGPTVDVVMQFLDAAHTVVSDFFIELTGPLHGFMERHDESKH